MFNRMAQIEQYFMGGLARQQLLDCGFSRPDAWEVRCWLLSKGEADEQIMCDALAEFFQSIAQDFPRTNKVGQILAFFKCGHWGGCFELDNLPQFRALSGQLLDWVHRTRSPRIREEALLLLHELVRLWKQETDEPIWSDEDLFILGADEIAKIQQQVAWFLEHKQYRRESVRLLRSMDNLFKRSKTKAIIAQQQELPRCEGGPECSGTSSV